MLELTPGERDALTAFLQELVRIPSPSGQEGAVAGRLAAEMRRLGISDVRTDRVGNVIGRVGAGCGPSLLFNGHMDTVGVGDPAAWRRDPFGGEVEAGRLYGRGAADMKGGLAAMVHAAGLLLRAGTPLHGDLYLAGVVQEEPYEGLAMRILVEEEGLRPDWVVLGEPSRLQVRRGHRGRLELRVTARGVACHASAPHLGDNAIYRAARLVGGLEALAGRLSRGPLPHGSLAVAGVESTAGSRNAVPDRCTLYLDRRLAWGESEAQAVAEVEEVAHGEAPHVEVEVTEYEAASYTGYRARQRSYFPAWELPADHPLVQVAAGAVRAVLGTAPEIGLWDFATDGVYTMGSAGIPTVGLGPGEERCAHSTDEWIALEEVHAAAGVYARLAADLLG